MDEYPNLHDEELASIPILLKLKRLEVGATSNNIKTMILDAMATYKGFSNNNIASKCISFGCDGDSMFQGIQASVITLTWE
jgi:hypothetical protein